MASSSLNSLMVLTEDDDVPGSKFERDPQEYTVDQLKRWLKCRGLKLSGKRDDLVKRVSDCIKSGNHHTLDALTMVNGSPPKLLKKVRSYKQLVARFRCHLFLRPAGVTFHLILFLLSLTMATCINTR